MPLKYQPVITWKRAQSYLNASWQWYYIDSAISRVQEIISYFFNLSNFATWSSWNQHGHKRAGLTILMTLPQKIEVAYK